MKFIFPKNYDFKSKLLGFIDYSTAIINLIWCVTVFLLLNIIPVSFTVKLCTFVLLCFPLFLFSIIGFQGENFMYVFLYMAKFIKSQKLYFYDA